ncbi:hypothetical protein CROQUDRAFT_662926 [Cronartium quercuum f. sp. fusiforme G11]|uniref:NAD-dependent epimerase/dehydratase domain-containing protein n=1 Tax=Cronartium quercuum f. sp. fusiforme G11 TaxID=708437 RepID=A0A9P6N8X1_9BASI|nr:hypothetical protein CROQUDRAFT_662926 [Cronartium quercuum f. sp. fusiforme G11]
MASNRLIPILLDGILRPQSTSKLATSASLTPLIPKRLRHDLVKHTTTGRLVQSAGPPGRHANAGQTVTVFGATGFLGRYLVHKLAKRGTQVIVPYRDEDSKRHLRVMGDLGQIVPLEFDLSNETFIDDCLRHSDVVYNLIGREYETKNYKFEDVFVTGAAKLAERARNAGVGRFIQLSHLNADVGSVSKYYRTKALGEQLVREIFPGATIVRPSTFFGPEDKFLNKMVTKPFTFKVNSLDTQVRPVHVLDVAEALEMMSRAPSTIGQTFELAGPRTYTYEELFEVLEALTLKSLTPTIGLPVWLLKLWCKTIDRLVWWPTLSEDEIVRRSIDDRETLSEGAHGFEYFGIQPELVDHAAISYLRYYRSSSNFDLPIQEGGMKLKQPPYNVMQ